MRSLFTALACLSLCLRVAAEPPDPVVPLPLTTPSRWIELKATPGRQLVLSAQAPAKWLPVDDGCDLIPAEGGKTATFSAPTAGRYRLVVVVAGEPSRVAVTVGELPPPPKPVPVDETAAKLKAAYDAEPSASKRDQVKDLAALYRQAAGLAADPTVGTSGQLLARVQTAAKTLVGSDSVKGIRQIAAAEVGAVLPVDGPLTTEQRTKVAALFKRLAQILESLP